LEAGRMSQRIRYIGLDVSKETIAVAEADGSVVEYGDIANRAGALRRLVETLARDAVVKGQVSQGAPDTRSTASSRLWVSRTWWWRLR
jgi:hypothetical protein